MILLPTIVDGVKHSLSSPALSEPHGSSQAERLTGSSSGRTKGNSLPSRTLLSLGDDEPMSLKDLSEKLVVLLVLISADRGSELAAHDFRLRKFHPEGVKFNLPELTKSVRVGKNLKSSFHASLPEDKLLCPCECLEVYESLTLRPVDPAQPNKIFLVKSGIDSNIFTAHFIRGAASSTAARAGLSVSDILRVADWSSDNTFQRFYYKRATSVFMIHLLAGQFLV